MFSLRQSILGLFALVWISTQSQVVINEVCSDNRSVLANPDGEFEDWVEIHNSGSVAVNLSDFFLSDDTLNWDDWQLPNQMLGPGGYIVFFSENDSVSNQYFDFGISSRGETVYLHDFAGNLVSSLAVPQLAADHSYGPYLQSANDLYYYGSPTPGSSNTTFASLGYAEPPIFQPPPKVFTSQLSVSISADPGHEIRFRTDGHIPDSNSTLYLDPLGVNESVAILAIAIGDSLLPSPPSAGSYLKQIGTQLPVMSIHVNPDTMFDPIHGMHVLGPNADTVYPYWGANYWEDRDIAAAVEFFTSNGVRVIDQVAELEIHGGRASRTHAQKPLRLTARSKLGSNRFFHEFFKERPGVDEYKRLVLRNSGSDHCLSNFRDGFWHQVSLHNHLDVDELAFQPAEVYINGEYWGIMNIRERIDEFHLALDYGINQDSLLLMEEENNPIQGDSLVFDSLYRFIQQSDMGDDTNWQYVESQLDLNSIKDYFALQMMAGNVDWPSNNLKYYKAKVDSGLWRYIFFDLDATMNIAGWIPNDLDSFDYLFNEKAGWMHTELFRKLHDNEEFQRLFINRFADLLNTAFTPVAMMEQYQLIVDQFGTHRPEHWDRWCFTEDSWIDHALGRIPTFINERQQVVRDDIENWYGLNDQVKLEFDVFPVGAGKIELNTIEPTLPFSGVYFNGNPIDMKAVSNGELVFDRWVFGTFQDESHHDPSWQWNPSESQRVTAYFKNNDNSIVLYPNPASTFAELAVETSSSSLARIDLLDASGRKLRTISTTMQAGMNRVDIDVSTMSTGVYYVRYSDANIEEVVRLLKY